MTRRLVIGLWVSLIVVPLWANPIDVFQAQAMAESFVEQSKVYTTSHRRSTSQAPILRQATTPSSAYYVFNYGQDEGYVVVSGDDATYYDILGYATEGSFCYDSISPAEQWWLSEYQRQIEEQSASLSSVSHSTIAATTPQVVVAPLLKTLWAQKSPFNLLCPAYKGSTCLVGCVATAWAQLAYFYKHPQSASGSYSYIWTTNDNTTLSGTIQSSYAWSQMATSYVLATEDAQKQAVAQLMADMAYMFQTNFGTSSSSAHPDVATGVMVSTFGFSPAMRFVRRKYYDVADADALLRAELDAGRPVLYAGWKESGGGHSFVCDGYNDQGMFHFNYGWGKSTGTYYRTSAMESDYNTGQQMVLGGVPAKGGENNAIDATFACDLTSTSKTTFPYSVSPRFSAHTTCKAEYALCAENLSTHACTYGSIKTLSLPRQGDWYSTGTGSYYFTFPSTTSLAKGTYRLYAVYRVSGDTQWRKIYYPSQYVSSLKLTVNSLGRTVGECLIDTLTFAESSVTLTEGESVTLTASVRPTPAKGTIWYTSADPSIAVVSKTTGKVIAAKAGTTTITATAQDGTNIQATYSITVLPSTATSLSCPTDNSNKAIKQIRHGSLYLYRNGKSYSASGQEL